MNNDCQLQDKYLGSFLGAAIGDALGWPNENRSSRMGVKSNFKYQFEKWSRHAGGRYFSHEETIGLGEYSDDTQLLLATARSLRYGKSWSKYFAAVELPTWLLYERGGGGATKRAANTWSKKVAPWTFVNNTKNESINPKGYFEAGGNGVAMRIMPHVYLCKTDIKEIMQQVVVNGIYTHGHPRALVGATLYAQALFYLINKVGTLGYGELIEYLLDSKENWGVLPSWNKQEEWLEAANLHTNKEYHNIWLNTTMEVENGLLIILDSVKQGVLDSTLDTLGKLNCFNNITKGAGTVAALVSIYLFSKFAASPELCMVESSSLQDADTDTIASMVGGLLGALHGSEWIKEEWYSVQDMDYIKKLVGELKEQERDYSNINYWTENNNNKVKDFIKQQSFSLPFQLGPFQIVELLEEIKHKPLVKNLNVETLKFKTDEGQTIYIKTISKPSRTKIDFIQEKNDKKNSYLSLEQINNLTNLFPNHITANQAFSLIAKIMNSIDNDFNSNETNQNFYLFKLGNPNLSSEELYAISSFIKQSLIENRIRQNGFEHQ